ncbi:MAG TPA: hypothetical protein VK284_01100 [Streptosporangiaceae bacterium]|nr:hypothetical protein [Streptosporangiaceae bacterium]
MRLLKSRTKAGLQAGAVSSYVRTVKTVSGTTAVQVECSSRRGPGARQMLVRLTPPGRQAIPAAYGSRASVTSAGSAVGGSGRHGRNEFPRD